MRKLNVINVRFYTVQLSDIQKKKCVKNTEVCSKKENLNLKATSG